jgi:hypothetical protein
MRLRPTVHNVVHLVLAAMGLVMLAIAYIDWIDYPYILRMRLP